MKAGFVSDRIIGSQEEGEGGSGTESTFDMDRFVVQFKDTLDHGNFGIDQGKPRIWVDLNGDLSLPGGQIQF